jgi:hypothetical protein
MCSKEGDLTFNDGFIKTICDFSLNSLDIALVPLEFKELHLANP